MRVRSIGSVGARHCAWGLVGVAALGAPPSGAAEAEVRESTVSFDSSATVEVTKDLLGITLQVLRDGNDAAAVQAQLKQVLDAALAEARKAAQTGAMDVRTGNFSLYPRHGKDGRISGWQGQAELVLEGKDAPRVAQTAGRLAGMNIVNVGYSISRELAEKHEAEVSAQAIQKYRALAATYAQQFGFKGYELREVSVQSVDQGGGPRPMMMQAKRELSMASDAPVPVEPGKGTLTATVSGSVRLLK